jgi:hypothetical protein
MRTCDKFYVCSKEVVGIVGRMRAVECLVECCVIITIDGD